MIPTQSPEIGMDIVASCVSGRGNRISPICVCVWFCGNYVVKLCLGIQQDFGAKEMYNGVM